MRFTTFDFVAFFVVVFTSYWLLPRRGQNVLLLVASYVFYGWIHPWFCGLIAFSSVLDYLCGLGMGRHPDRKQTFLWISLAGNVGMLCVFKYTNFFIENVREVFGVLGLDVGLPVWEILLPVGISFYTFQTLSYTIDIYRGRMQPRKSLLDFAVFVSLFPQLVAGPIERAVRLLPQIENRRTLNFDRIETGVCLIVWGYFKKLVIADNIAVYADRIYELEQPAGMVLLAGAFGFLIQVFADFSAYADIARGVARLFGFELMQNFNGPHLASNPSDYWRRWHISLSTWLRDYIYFPLGGSRAGPGRFAFAAIATFGISGLWHGAAWNYVVFGIYHGLLVTVYHLWFQKVGRWSGKHIGDLPTRLAGIVVVFVLTLIGYLFFRQHDFARIGTYFTTNPFVNSPEEIVVGLGIITLGVALCIPMMLRPLALTWAPNNRPMRAVFAWACLGSIFVLGRETGVDFVYFAF